MFLITKRLITISDTTTKKTSEIYKLKRKVIKTDYKPDQMGTESQ